MNKVQVLTLIGALAVVSACAGTTPTTPTKTTTPVAATPSSASIQSAITKVLSGVTAAINGTRSGSQGLTGSPPVLGRGVGFIQPQSFSTQCNASGTSCSILFNETFNQMTACGNGGSSTVSGTLTGVISGSATFTTGALNMATRSTFADCSDNEWVTNGNPSISSNGQIFITGQHTRINLTMSGGFRMTNAPGTANGAASCVFNGVILQWDDITGNWANSGSVDCTPGGSFRFS